VCIVHEYVYNYICMYAISGAHELPKTVKEHATESQSKLHNNI